MNISTDAYLVSETINSDVDSIKHNTTPEPAAVENNSPGTLPGTVADNSPSFAQSAAMSYSSVSRSTGAVPKQIPKSQNSPPKTIVWTNQLKKIIEQYKQGSRILIIMRGVPGSGKTFLAKQIIEATIGGTRKDYLTHIFSTDDFFIVRGQYVYEKYRLSEAHDWNQNRVRKATRQGLSPIIIDNTNVDVWEMEPYVTEGVRHGYFIEVVEPNTPWARKAHQLSKKNTHNVPSFTIKRMLTNYKEGVTGEYLINSFGLSYPADLVPPVERSIPTYIPELSSKLEAESVTEPKNQMSNQNVDESQCVLYDVTPQTETVTSSGDETNPQAESIEEVLMHQQKYWEIEKQLEEIEEVDENWENGESWEDQNKDTTNNDGNKSTVSLEPKPQRMTTSEGSTPRDDFFENVQRCDDWSKISMFMTPWKDEASTITTQATELPVTEMKSSSTCMEIGDTDIINPKKILKVITATPKDINLFHIPFRNTKIPEKRMLDKSTMTNELLITQAFRCKNEEQHFVAFRKLFKNVPRAELRDVFDKCCGDVNWAVDIVLNGMGEKQLQMVDREDISDTEEELQEQCDCLAAYNVIPDMNTTASTSTAATVTGMTENIPSNPTETCISIPKKMKMQSDSALQLKREIEKNFQISSDYYSDHVLKLKRWRNGDYTDDNSDNKNTPTPSISTETVPTDLPVHTSKGSEQEDIQSTKGSSALNQSDDDESNTSSLDEAERTITVNLGFEFVAQLDDLFGRRGMSYPQSVAPKINIPVSLVNEINAFWMESLMCQLDDLDKQNNKMILEDEEFARQLALKEQELAQQGKEPEVPDLKEIMDMDFALSLYQRDVAEWRNKEPKDIAAKMSRDKLYNLFPDMAPELLSELLMAHDNNFQATVEVLLMSTGRSEILEEKNGVNKFVMAREMERQEKLLEEQKKALSEVEWPLLPSGSKVEMSTVNNYRQEAEQHLARRNMSYQKAQEYIRRGMTQVANYYSDIAAFHKNKYEQANSMAAASLMHLHAENCDDTATIDLHYLRVGEAKESLDLFLDTHIQKLRESTNKNVRFHTLFFITGRGLHSNGGPRVKPAVKKRLRERGLICTERNPGLLTARVCADDRLSYQVP